MKKAVVSFAAVLVLLASLTSPSFAAGSNSASNSKGSITINMPSTAAAGSTIRITGEFQLFADGTSDRKPVQYILSISNEGGVFDRMPLRQGVRLVPPGVSKSFTRNFTISNRVHPGDYTVFLNVVLDGEPLEVSMPLTITAR